VSDIQVQVHGALMSATRKLIIKKQQNIVVGIVKDRVHFLLKSKLINEETEGVPVRGTQNFK
jgi:hypothetical protein